MPPCLSSFPSLPDGRLSICGLQSFHHSLLPFVWSTDIKKQHLCCWLSGLPKNKGKVLPFLTQELYSILDGLLMVSLLVNCWLLAFSLATSVRATLSFMFLLFLMEGYSFVFYAISYLFTELSCLWTVLCWCRSHLHITKA